MSIPIARDAELHEGHAMMFHNYITQGTNLSSFHFFLNFVVKIQQGQDFQIQSQKPQTQGQKYT